jgi:hypothetical protein
MGHEAWRRRGERVEDQEKMDMEDSFAYHGILTDIVNDPDDRARLRTNMIGWW